MTGTACFCTQPLPACSASLVCVKLGHRSIGPVKPNLQLTVRIPGPFCAVIRRGNNIRCIGLVQDLMGPLSDAIRGAGSRTEKAPVALGMKGIELKVKTKHAFYRLLMNALQHRILSSRNLHFRLSCPPLHFAHCPGAISREHAVSSAPPRRGWVMFWLCVL